MEIRADNSWMDRFITSTILPRFRFIGLPLLPSSTSLRRPRLRHKTPPGFLRGLARNLLEEGHT
ncbi:unnamed protein product [Strongylus vulgaris]|uniref:Uncharacterized protein n=1 Tax=Strongylus vulgaris TaxID=40348 RepID=A0A3P7JLS2_STRVU|nr:unnamed protein product [Strongylus vulgaris]